MSSGAGGRHFYDAYVGEYDYGNDVILTVTKEDDRLFAQLVGQEKYDIFPKLETEFFWKVVDAQIDFVKDEQGKVIKAIHRQVGIDIIEAPKIKSNPATFASCQCLVGQNRGTPVDGCSSSDIVRSNTTDIKGGGSQ